METFVLPFILIAFTLIYLFFRLFRHFTGKQLLKIASPCSLYWKDLKGNSKVRFCDVCNKNVHNVCNMPKAERKVLLDKLDAGENVCIYIEPPFLKKAGYFAFALIMCLLTKAGYREYNKVINPNESGIMMGAVLNENNFSDFGNINN